MNLAQLIDGEAVCDGRIGMRVIDKASSSASSADAKATVTTHVRVRGRKAAIIAHLKASERGTMRGIFDAVGLPNFEAHSVMLALMRKEKLIASSGRPGCYIYRLTATGRAYE